MISASKIKEIRRLQMEGVPKCHIARRVNVGRSTVYRHLAPVKRKIPKRFKMMKAITMQGGRSFSIGQIATIAGLPHNTAKRLCSTLFQEGLLLRLKNGIYCVADIDMMFQAYISAKDKYAL